MTISLHTQTSAPNTAAATSVSPLEQSGSSKTNFSRTKTDICQSGTDSIISALETDVKPWSCPWQHVPGMSGLPSKYATGAAYSGMNIMLLWCSASKQGFSDSRWMTYKQAKAEGGQVREGEHGTTAIFYTTLEKENDVGKTDYIPMLKTFTVFNAEQIYGLPLNDEAVCPAETFELLPRAEALFRNFTINNSWVLIRDFAELASLGLTRPFNICQSSSDSFLRSLHPLFNLVTVQSLMVKHGEINIFRKSLNETINLG